MKKHILKVLGMTLSCFMVLVLTSTMAFASTRKLITKTVSGSFWTNNCMRYSFNASAGLTYSGSTISSISDLSFSAISCWSTVAHTSGTIAPRQTNKYFSGNTATYKVTVTRNANGVYGDKVDYTLTYRTTDSGTPYSLDGEIIEGVLVSVEESEPYDIVFYE